MRERGRTIPSTVCNALRGLLCLLALAGCATTDEQRFPLDYLSGVEATYQLETAREALPAYQRMGANLERQGHFADAAIADLILLPSEEEAFGLAALEAMSCAVPVVATRVGGLPEVVEDGKNGFLLPPGDVDGMVRAALALLTDRGRHAEFREAARRRAVAHFDTSLIVPQYEAYYREIATS